MAPIYNAGLLALLGCSKTVRSAMSDTELNLRGLKCPLPALKTRKALRALAPGDRLLVACSDPLAALDIPNLIRETRDVLEEQREQDGVLVFAIRKSGEPTR